MPTAHPPHTLAMTNVSNELPSAEIYAPAVSTSSAPPIDPSVDSAFALSPIQRLPSELFNEIFLHCTTLNEYGTLNRHHGCWPLLGVCWHWYDLATTSSELWRDIRVWVNCVAKCRDPVAALSLVLSRAGNMDLFIEFNATPVEDEEGNVVGDISNLALDLLTMLMKHSAQWRTIHLAGIDADSLSVLKDVEGRIPRLLALDLQPQAGVWKEFPNFSYAPQLERWSLFISAGQGLAFNWLALQEQLTEFDMEGIRYKSSLVEVLRECPRLKCLKLHFALESPLVDVRVTSQLTELYLKDFLDDLALVHLPNLSLLRIGTKRDSSLVTVVPALLDLIKYSRCPLTFLELVNCDVEGLKSVLELVPFLKDLIIEFGEHLPRSMAFIDAVDQNLLELMLDLGRMDLVPTLEHFGITVSMKKKGLPEKMTFVQREWVKEILLLRKIEHNEMGWFFYFPWDGVAMTSTDGVADDDDDDDEEETQEE